MRKIILFGIACLLLFLTTNQCQLDEATRTEALYDRYCGGCHLAPSPEFLSKDLWRTQVLPEMGARLGVKVGDYNPMKGLGMEEAYFIEQTGTYPTAPLISPSDWQLIYDYVLQLAPDSLVIDTTRRVRSKPLHQFRARNISIDKLSGAQVTALYQADDQLWWIGDRSGAWYTWSQGDSSKLVNLFSSTISGFDRFGDEEVVLEMGYMNPSDVPRGKLWRFERGKRRLLAQDLHRPVFVESTDMNENGEPEYLICEFGHRSGRLSMLQKEGPDYKKYILLNQPGMIRIQLADMNADGRKDIVALSGQGDEGIYILYQEKDGSFSPVHPIRLPPIYGSSWFELFDYDGDGDLDIALVNGDNADFTYALKPYHGLRLFINEGKEQFEEVLFYPIYGATRLIARDFDQDGDVDFAVAALFPDFERNAQASFLYLENQNAASFNFQSYTFPATQVGHWLVAETGDVDQDGDLDLLLGAYTGSPAPVPDSLNRSWRRGNVDLLLLENLKQ